MEKQIDEILGMVLNIRDSMRVKNNEWPELNTKIGEAFAAMKRMTKLQEENNELRLQTLELESQAKMLNLELSDVEGKKVVGQALSTMHSTTPSLLPGPLNQASSCLSASSFSSSFGTGSKKAIDAVIEDQGSSRTSANSLSGNKRVLGSSGNLNLGMSSSSKPKPE
jgi:hypothetical protein